MDDVIEDTVKLSDEFISNGIDVKIDKVYRKRSK